MYKLKVDGNNKYNDTKDEHDNSNYKSLLANEDIFSMEVSSIFYVDSHNSSQQNRKKPTTNIKVSQAEYKCSDSFPF